MLSAGELNQNRMPTGTERGNRMLSGAGRANRMPSGAENARMAQTVLRSESLAGVESLALQPRRKKRGVKLWAAIARPGRWFPSRKRVISACLLAYFWEPAADF